MTGPKIAVLDYGIGNLRSAEKALQHVGAAARLVTDPAEVEAADAVVLPGVGAFGACARALHESGLEPVARAALAADVPFLAVCIGFQLLYESSDESPEATGLGIFGGRVAPLAGSVKHPQMQWNQLESIAGGSDGSDGPGGRAGSDGSDGSRGRAGSDGSNGSRGSDGPWRPAPLRGLGPLHGLGERPWVYFVHSYAPPVGAETVAVCDYGGPVAALVARRNLWGAQFHPEKSGRTGLALLSNFVAVAA